MKRSILSVFLILLLAPSIAFSDAADRLGDLTLPPGFSVAVFAEVPGARSLAIAEDLGTVFVGTRGRRVFAVEFTPGAEMADRVTVLKNRLKVANGIAWTDGQLFVAEQHRIVRFRGNDLKTLAAARAEQIFAALPDKRHHGWRYARIGPDQLLYVAVGAPCNVCSVDGYEATIIRLPLNGLNGGQAEIVAHGVRNSVGFDFQPETGDFYFTDNGADWMGDDSPPDELNRLTEAGDHFGYPWYGGGEDRTPDFRNSTPPTGVRFPVVRFGAHVAALGMRFYRGGMFPAGFRGDAFVAQRGSWNRSIPDGYRVVRVTFDASGRATGYEPFIEGWLSGSRAWGRPVDVAELPDGSLLVSDNEADVIYRVTYGQ